MASGRRGFDTHRSPAPYHSAFLSKARTAAGTEAEGTGAVWVQAAFVASVAAGRLAEEDGGSGGGESDVEQPTTSSTSRPTPDAAPRAIRLRIRVSLPPLCAPDEPSSSWGRLVDGARPALRDSSGQVFRRDAVAMPGRPLRQLDPAAVRAREPRHLRAVRASGHSAGPGLRLDDMAPTRSRAGPRTVCGRFGSGSCCAGLLVAAVLACRVVDGQAGRGVVDQGQSGCSRQDPQRGIRCAALHGSRVWVFAPVSVRRWAESGSGGRRRSDSRPDGAAGLHAGGSTARRRTSSGNAGGPWTSRRRSTVAATSSTESRSGDVRCRGVRRAGSRPAGGREAGLPAVGRRHG